MIFISAGTQFPFDRLIQSVDEIADTLGEEVVAQALPGEYKPRHFDLQPTISRDSFDDYVRRARIVVSHAGMGTIITAMLLSKPIIIFPRRAGLGEHRNDHQMDTASKFDEMQYLNVAYTPQQLKAMIVKPDIQSLHQVTPNASTELSEYVEEFIRTNRP